MERNVQSVVIRNTPGLTRTIAQHLGDEAEDMFDEYYNVNVQLLFIDKEEMIFRLVQSTDEDLAENAQLLEEHIATIIEAVEGESK